MGILFGSSHIHLGIDAGWTVRSNPLSFKPPHPPNTKYSHCGILGILNIREGGGLNPKH